MSVGLLFILSIGYGKVNLIIKCYICSNSFLFAKLIDLSFGISNVFCICGYPLTGRPMLSKVDGLPWAFVNSKIMAIGC